MVFSVDITVCSKNSLHAVFDGYNLCNALSKRGKRYTYNKIINDIHLNAPSILSKIIWINCFDLAQMSAILDFIHNAMSKVLSYYITMSGITEARMLDTKIKNLRLFCRK